MRNEASLQTNFLPFILHNVGTIEVLNQLTDGKEHFTQDPMNQSSIWTYRDFVLWRKTSTITSYWNNKKKGQDLFNLLEGRSNTE